MDDEFDWNSDNNNQFNIPSRTLRFQITIWKPKTKKKNKISLSNEEGKKKIFTWVIHFCRKLCYVCTETVHIYFVCFFSVGVSSFHEMVLISFWSLPWHWQLIQITFAVVNNSTRKKKERNISILYSPFSIYMHTVIWYHISIGTAWKGMRISP